MTVFFSRRRGRSSRPSIELLEDRSLLSTARLVFLDTPGKSSDAVIPVAVSTHLAQANACLIDVDLNHDGRFSGPGERGYAQGNLGTLNLHGLAIGSYQLRARVTTSSREYVSAVERLQVIAPPANKLPVSFEPNVGQAEDGVLFMGRAQDQTVYITADETLLVSKPGDGPAEMQRFRLLGARPAPVSGQGLLPGVANYFLGNDASQWRTDVATYGSVVRSGVYDGIDLVYHSKQNRLEYDFHVAPGADPSVITLEFPDAQVLSLDADGSLLIHQSDGVEVRKSAPVMYQEIAGRTVAVKGDWVLKGPNLAGYTIAGYDASHELVIDPIIFSTLFGGSGNDGVTAGTSDASGNFYFAGDTNSTDLPVPGGFQTTAGGGGDVYVAKVNAAGTALIYCTYIGGSSGDGGNMGIAVSNTGEVAITSSTNSANFPLLNPVQSSIVFFADNFVTKLNAAGNALVFSTYLGSGGFENATGVAFDTTGAVYATGQSQNGGFPTTPGAYQRTYAGGGLGGDVFVTKFSPTGAMDYSTFIGGSGDDTAQAITVFGTNAIVSGKTVSANYPTTPGAYQTFMSGGQDMFVTQLNSTGSALVYSTFLGGSAGDGGGTFAPAHMGLTVDAAGNAYIGSTTSSNDFPTTPGAFQTTSGGSDDAVLVKLNPSGTGLVFSTYLGGSGGEAIYGVVLDASNNVYFAGDSNSGNFPLRSQFQNYIGPFSVNALIGQVDATGSNLLFATMMGSGGVSGRAIGLDGTGTIWVAGPGNASVSLVNPLFSAPAGNNGFIARVAPSTPGVTITPSGGSTNVTEGGATDNITVVLNTPPTANVILTFTGTQLAANPIRLTFTPANWNVNQGLIVSAAIDFVAEGLHSGTLSTTATSTDATYNGIAVADLTASITDDDVAGITLTQTGGNTSVTEGGATDTYTVVLSSQPTANVVVTLAPNAQVSVAPAVLTFTAANWSVGQPVTVTAVNDFVAEGAHSGVVSHSTTSTDAAYNGLALAAVTATITDNDNAGITVTASGGTTNLAEGGATDTFTISLSSQPIANVVVSVNPGSQVSTPSSLVTFTPANWNLTQTVTVAAVDDMIAEGVHNGVISFALSSSDVQYSGLTVPAATASITDNDTPGVSVTPTGGSTDVVEGGATDTYRVVLLTQPTANVVITPTSAQLTGSPAALTFTPANWNTPQFVTVTANDDLVFEGPHTGVITHTVASTDLPYNGLVIANVTANVTDNDLPPGVLVGVAATGLTFLEGGSDVYTLRLTTQPLADVVVNLGPGTQLSVLQPSLTFTAANWNVPQTVNVTAAEDGVPEGGHTGLVTHNTVSADPSYNGVATNSATAHIVDNDGTSVLGTDKNDRIFVNFAAGKIQVIVNGKSTFLTTPIAQLLILAGDGNDYVQVTTPTIPVVVLGSNGTDSVFVQGAATANTFVVDSTSVTANGRGVSLWQAESLTVGGRTADDTMTIASMPAFTTEFKGDRGNDTLIAANGTNTWRSSAANIGTLNTNFRINGVENWTGGSGDDTFLFAAGKGVTGTINGAAGSNTLDYSAFLTPVSVNLQTGAATATKTIQNIQSILGGLASDKLTGPNQVNTWTVTASNMGDVNGIRFQNFENLTGGTLADTFLLSDTAGVRGKIDGGTGIDVLDYSSYLFAVAVNLQAKTATNTGGIVNLESFVGGASTGDSLTAVNSLNTWTLTGLGTGTLNSVAFAAFENYTGGTTVDNFTLNTAAAGWTGLINGAGGNDALFAFPGGINVYISISRGTGTLNGARFSSIEASH